MHGYRSQQLDPLTLLGIEARTDEERQRYAGQLARIEHDRVERLLAFQRAYDDAFARLYPNEQAIADDTSLRRTAETDTLAQTLLQNGQRPRVFTALERCAACDRTVRRLVSQVTSGALAALDIYVVGASSDDAIRDWAQSLSIPADRVRRRDITLNHAPDGIGRSDLPRVLGTTSGVGE
ncbi:probable exported protein STY4558 [Alloalcanivorax xenomutans]|nr:probable exported protein STY4558 [Alloalcanivorax xenomutans]